MGKKKVDPEAQALGDALAEILTEIKSNFKPHSKYGSNFHPVICRRCEAVAHPGVPFGDHNQVFPCDCGHLNFETEGASKAACKKCNTIIDDGFNMKEYDPIASDKLCPVCEVNQEDQRSVAKQGGAVIRCRNCHTMGTLPPDDINVKDFRLKKKVKKGRMIHFDIRADQCPRCLMLGRHRTFTPTEATEVILDNENYAKAMVEATEAEFKKAKANRKVKEASAAAKAFTSTAGSKMSH